MAKAAAIKYALALRDYTQADVARECGVSRNTVHLVIHSRGRSKKIELRIAAITRLPLAELWPEWHGPKAGRRRHAANTAHSVAALRAAS